VFAVTAIGYLVVPGVMLSVVGVASNDTADFLLRTEGVALLTGAMFLWAARSGPPRLIRIVLAGLGVYYLLGSLVDLTAFTDGSLARPLYRAPLSASHSASCASWPSLEFHLAEQLRRGDSGHAAGAKVLAQAERTSAEVAGPQPPRDGKVLKVLGL